MPFKPKKTRGKTKSLYKTIYLSQSLAEQVEQMAAENETSFNNIVVSMIEYCIDEQGKTKDRQ